ncbi:MAG: hypothetical protein JST21_05595 [Bacteroidetes bacterium]|nr:hypothetical protein [Bacteroidota bacterium]
MKYLNFVLTLIAGCLLIITFNLLGFIPAAHANTTAPHFATIPVNPDGSINVKFIKGETVDVNIDAVGGYSQNQKTLDINVEEIDGETADYPLQVDTN